jgi:hypothetical protein
MNRRIVSFLVGIAMVVAALLVATNHADARFCTGVPCRIVDLHQPPTPKPKPTPPGSIWDPGPPRPNDTFEQLLCYGFPCPQLVLATSMVMF